MRYLDTEVEHLASEATVLIDVREPYEFADYHVPGSINKPLAGIRIEEFEAYTSKKICLICNSGARAKSVAKKLDLLGYSNVFLAAKQLEDMNPRLFALDDRKPTKSSRWSVDRQFRFVLGLLLVIYLLLFYFDFSLGILVPSILAVGLIVTSVINRCYLRMAIGKLPWNT
ncbi:MAG: rhodanese-like domain-containing protein [Saprospiraceae bacterium]